jgi:hypothetical protein
MEGRAKGEESSISCQLWFPVKEEVWSCESWGMSCFWFFWVEGEVWRDNHYREAERKLVQEILEKSHLRIDQD